MIEEAISTVLNGGIVGIPTDTVYGIGADPFNEGAVNRLFEIKGRPHEKPVGVLVASVEQASEIGALSEYITDLVRRHWPGALTVVVNPRVILSDWVGDQQLRTVGLRVPDHPLALELLRSTGPLAVTSANRSGGLETMNDREARDIFGAEVDVYLEGFAPGGEASTVVDATGVELLVIRQGPIQLA